MEETTRSCLKALVPVRDTLDILNGKWKLPLIISLSLGPKDCSPAALFL
jgi:DNA-binding HxlR family transcriptional regulator